MKMNSILETSIADCHPASVPDYTPLPELRALQLQRVRAVVARAWDHVELFRARMDERGLVPEDIRILDDVARLPFTVKSDLRDTYPFGLFASPMKDVVRLHVSSGTTGKPIVVAYTRDDVNVWTSVMVRCMAGCGLHRGDIFQNAYGYGLFTGGLGAHYGAEALGATVVPTSGGNADRQIMLLKDFGVTAICCTPTYFLHLIDRAAELGVDLKELPLRAGVFGAEPWTESMRRHIESKSGIEAFDIYGLSEIIGPGVACECRRHQGLHIFEDHFYPEIIDPESGEPGVAGGSNELSPPTHHGFSKAAPIPFGFGQRLVVDERGKWGKECEREAHGWEESVHCEAPRAEGAKATTLQRLVCTAPFWLVWVVPIPAKGVVPWWTPRTRQT